MPPESGGTSRYIAKESDRGSRQLLKLKGCQELDHKAQPLFQSLLVRSILGLFPAGANSAHDSQVWAISGGCLGCSIIPTWHCSYNPDIGLPPAPPIQVLGRYRPNLPTTSITRKGENWNVPNCSYLSSRKRQTHVYIYSITSLGFKNLPVGIHTVAC